MAAASACLTVMVTPYQTSPILGAKINPVWLIGVALYSFISQGPVRQALAGTFILVWSQAQNPELINDILDINIAGIRDILSPLFLRQTLYSFFKILALSRSASISPAHDPPSLSVLPTVSPLATIFGPCHLLFLQLSFSFSPLRTGLVIWFERCEKDLSSCTLLHFYPRLHGSISEFLSPVLLMRCRYPGADEPFGCTQSGDGKG